MAHRKARCEKTDFASELEKLGFKQVGDCTFFEKRIKIFRTNKTNSERKRYWEVQEISTGMELYKSNHCHDVLEYLRHSQFYVNGAEIIFRIS